MIITCNYTFCVGMIHSAHGVFGALCTSAAFQFREGNSFYFLNTLEIWILPCGFIFFAFATIKATGDHCSSTDRNHFFPGKSWLILLIFFKLFFSEISICCVECCKIWWRIVPWKNKSAFLGDIVTLLRCAMHFAAGGFVCWTFVCFPVCMGFLQSTLPFSNLFI